MIVKKRAHTITELLMTSVIIVLLFASVLGAFVLTKSVSSSSMANYNLQRDVNTVFLTMIRGIKEGSGTFGLRSAAPPPTTYLPGMFPATGEIDFQGADTVVRRYFLSNNTIIYDSPTQVPRQKVIYTAPPNSTITLSFTPVSVDQQLVYVYFSVLQQIANKTYSGSVATYVNLRNTQK